MWFSQLRFFCSGMGNEGSLVSAGGGNLVTSVTKGSGFKEAAATVSPLVRSISDGILLRVDLVLAIIVLIFNLK